MKVVQEKEKLTKQIEKIGLWISRTEIEDGLKTFVKQAKKEALKLQINFRHRVLGQVHPNKNLFVTESNTLLPN